MLNLEPFQHHCNAMGGALVRTSEAHFKAMERADNHFESAPASDYHGVDYHRKVLYVVPDYATVNGLIHEMGHVFACHDEPHKAAEEDFLAWEVFTALDLGVYREWSRGNTGYGTGYLGQPHVDGAWDEWGGLNAKWRAKFIRDCVEHGLQVGNLVWRHVLTEPWGNLETLDQVPAHLRFIRAKRILAPRPIR